jgi:16S rRNA (guanine527-N7)-methyltransferase
MSDESLSARIRAGANECGLRLEPTQLGQLTQYLSHLERWNRTINLTALPLSEFPLPTLDRLILEPLRACSLFAQGPLEWLDLGSGGGSPAIPLRIVLPDTSLTMVEARSRKAAFLRDVVRAIGLNGVQVMWGRAEALQDSIAASSVDVLTARALRMDEQVSKSMKQILKDSGRVILFGPVDWTYLARDFNITQTLKTTGEVTVLQRRLT